MCVSKRVVFDLLEGFLDLGIAVLTCAYRRYTDSS